MTSKEKNEIIHMYKLGYKPYEIAEKVKFSEAYIANFIRMFLLDLGTTPQQYEYERRMNSIKHNQECYRDGLRDGMNIALRYISDDEVKAKIIEEYGKIKDI